MSHRLRYQKIQADHVNEHCSICVDAVRRKESNLRNKNVGNERICQRLQISRSILRPMKRKLLIVVAVLFVVALIGMRVVKEFRSANVAATHSAAAQLHQDLIKKGQQEEFTNDWMVLSDARYYRLLTSLLNAGVSFDAPPRWKTPNEKLVDAWGSRFQIAARRMARDEGIEYVVWSAGPDGQSGTDDDIVVPAQMSNEVRDNKGVKTVTTH